jgi:hypothetical protein
MIPGEHLSLQCAITYLAQSTAALPVQQNHLAEIRNVTSCASVQAFIPPSTVRFAPVMYEDSGPATNATIAAISSTRP